MSDLLQRALAALTDRSDLNWDVAEAEALNDDERELIRSLRDVARIGRECSLPAATARPRSVPFTWGLLQVLQWMARGAHGDVYRAWDARLEREVALKLLRPTSAGDEEAVAVSEGRLLARVHDPNVVSVYGADRIEGQAGIWMEFLSGRTLREEVESRGSLPPGEAIACAIEVCSALAAVHRAGLIHRDVKAQNIIRTTSGRTVLMDFGAGEDARSQPRGIEGTPVYLAPELLAGGTASHASEVYAVGVLLFFMLTGSYPVSGSSLQDLRRAHDSGIAPDRTSSLAGPPALRGIVARALAPKPGDRFATAEALGAALRDVSGTSAAGQRKRFATAAAVLTFAVTACLAAVASETWHPSKISDCRPSRDAATGRHGPAVKKWRTLPVCRFDRSASLLGAAGRREPPRASSTP